MLCRLTINHLAIVHSQSIEMHPGLTVLTGETGAGKSLLLDGLGLILGGRADSSLVTQGRPRAEVSAQFDLKRLPAAQGWLTQHELEDPEHPDDLHIRRTLTADGRSKAYINGRPITLLDLKDLASQLVSLQGQHAQYALLNSDEQCRILDRYGELQASKARVRACWHEFQTLEKQRQTLIDQIEQSAAHRDLLSYQVEELTNAELVPDELQDLETRLKKLANAQEYKLALGLSHQAIKSGPDNAIAAIEHALKSLDPIGGEASEVVGMLNEALVNLQESSAQLTSLEASIDEDPGQLTEVEQRLQLLTDLARKHRISADELYEHAQALSQQLADIADQDQSLPEITQQCTAAQQALEKAAQQLTQARVKTADQLGQLVTQQVHRLELEDAMISIQVTPRALSADGADHVEFLLTTNPGSPAKPLSKVASGGELSRVALAIQVSIAEKMETPTLIFDEVDVGIGGRTAAVVGELLKGLGRSTQVFVVTHQPQVAAAGQTHLHVSKTKTDHETRSNVTTLNPAERVEEVARMLGGLTLTDATRKSAQELIMSA